MKIQPTTLRAMHRIHRQLTDLREQLARGPKQVAAAESNVKKADDDAARAKDVVKQAKLLASQKELQQKERDARIKDLKRKLNEAQSNREYSTLKEQIAADEQASSVLSDEILEALEKIESHQKQVAEAEQAIVRAKQELQKVRDRVDQERASLEADVARLSAELKTVEEELPVDFKKDFDRIVKARGENAMAPVEGEVCGGCYSTITAQMQSELRLAKPVFCKSCGRLLYMPE